MAAAYKQHEGKVAEAGKRFEHVMAITLDPCSSNQKGLIRCITSREGDVEVRGYVDRSKLFYVAGDSLEHFEIGELLNLKNQKEIIDGLIPGDLWDFIGLEDPDLWIDGKTGLTHLYFTIAIISRDRTKAHSLISLGHAEGFDLSSLVMTRPVLIASRDHYEDHKAKEVSIAPLNSQGVRLNLFESGNRRKDTFYDTSKFAEDTSFSTVRVAVARDMGKEWEFGDTVFHPADHKIPWIAEHASPGPLLPRSFIDLGPERLVGIMNGREASEMSEPGASIRYKTFSVGLFIYNFEYGKIEWVSPEPLIRDTEAKTITFASQFVETGGGEGILYAHVDDSFVRAYTLYAKGIKSLLP